MGIKEQLILVLQKWFLSILAFLQPLSVLKDVECTDMHSGLLAGKCLSDLLFPVDHHGQPHSSSCVIALPITEV
jgi:hypothetical protein